MPDIPFRVFHTVKDKGSLIDPSKNVHIVLLKSVEE
jgi:hypothetical protein